MESNNGCDNNDYSSGSIIVLVFAEIFYSRGGVKRNKGVSIVRINCRMYKGRCITYQIGRSLEERWIYKD